MGKLFNRQDRNYLRRRLRHQMTKAEWNLWLQIKNRQLQNCKFRRQYSIDNFIVDFYAPEYKLAIEVDGDSHFISPEKKIQDKKRQKFLEDLGIKMLRFTDNDINESLEQVIEIIGSVLQKTPSISPLLRGRK